MSGTKLCRGGTGKRVGDARESVIVGKAGFGLVPGAEVDGKVPDQASRSHGSEDHPWIPEGGLGRETRENEGDRGPG
jgi:hypothetical protein